MNHEELFKEFETVLTQMMIDNETRISKGHETFADYLKSNGLKGIFEILFGKMSPNVTKCYKNYKQKCALLAGYILRYIEKFWIFRGYEQELQQLIDG